VLKLFRTSTFINKKLQNYELFQKYGTIVNNWDANSDHMKDIKQRKFSEEIQMKK
jgi:hypothetical protein